ncbi:MAG: dTMP kinase [Firmicutes bacterium]|nr:dTMP kinase [Bacillota bacterium]
MSKGFLITLEGIDGAGKTTQASLLAAQLMALGFQVLRTREPGGTEVCSRIRDLLLAPVPGGCSDLVPLTELLLLAADRAQHVAEILEPALSCGKVVVCERFTDSTLAYQGYGLGLSLETIDTVNRLSTAGLTPDLTLLLDVEPRTGLSRRPGRSGRGTDADRIEGRGLPFLERVRAGFRALALSEPRRIRLIDCTSGSIPEIHDVIVSTVEKELGECPAYRSPDGESGEGGH